MDFGQPHKNTVYAENLDFEQELEKAKIKLASKKTTP